MNTKILALILIASFLVASTGSYVEHVERVQQDFPSLTQGYMYKYKIEITTQNSQETMWLTVTIDEVEIYEDYFNLTYTITKEDKATSTHTDTKSFEYGCEIVDLGDIWFYNTREYDTIIGEYDSNYLSYYWFGTTPIRVLILEKTENEMKETITIAEDLGVILDLTITNSTHTIHYYLEDTNAISKYLGLITILGIIIGIIVMAIIFKELKKHHETT